MTIGKLLRRRVLWVGLIVLSASAVFVVIANKITTVDLTDVKVDGVPVEPCDPAGALCVQVTLPDGTSTMKRVYGIDVRTAPRWQVEEAIKTTVRQAVDEYNARAAP